MRAIRVDQAPAATTTISALYSVRSVPMRRFPSAEPERAVTASRSIVPPLAIKSCGKEFRQAARVPHVPRIRRKDRVLEYRFQTRFHLTDFIDAEQLVLPAGDVHEIQLAGLHRLKCVFGAEDPEHAARIKQFICFGRRDQGFVIIPGTVQQDRFDKGVSPDAVRRAVAHKREKPGSQMR